MNVKAARPFTFAAVGAALLFAAVGVSGQTGKVAADSAKATYKEIIPGVSAAVVKGAYIHKPEKGVEQRIGPGQFIMIPGGDRHVTESDAKEGALIYARRASLGASSI